MDAGPVKLRPLVPSERRTPPSRPKPSYSSVLSRIDKRLCLLQNDGGVFRAEWSHEILLERSLNKVVSQPFMYTYLCEDVIHEKSLKEQMALLFSKVKTPLEAAFLIALVLKTFPLRLELTYLGEAPLQGNGENMVRIKVKGSIIYDYPGRESLEREITSSYVDLVREENFSEVLGFMQSGGSYFLSEGCTFIKTLMRKYFYQLDLSLYNSSLLVNALEKEKAAALDFRPPEKHRRTP